MEPKGIDDPYNHGAYLGLERAVRELGVRGRVLTPAPKEGYVPSVALLARQKYDLVIGMGFFAAAAIDKVANGFPETRFAIIDVAHDESGASPDERPGSRVQRRASRVPGRPPGCARADALARARRWSARSAASGYRGSQRWIAGYQAGARRANPRVTTLHSYTDDFSTR